MKVIIDAIMSTDQGIINIVDEALSRKSVPLEQSRYANKVICVGTDEKKPMLTALRIMSMMPIADLVAMLSPIYKDHSESISAIFSINDEKSESNFKRVIRSINGNGLVSNSLNDETLMNLKKALKREDE